MGKGKGKDGGGKGGPCYRCRGQGHLARSCSTPEGSTAEHVCMLCGGCGHFAREHQEQTSSWQTGQKGESKGGDGLSYAAKSKGKGKYGKNGGFSSGYGKGYGKSAYGKGQGEYGKGKGKGKCKRSMNSCDDGSGAQYGTIAETDCDWERAGSENWGWDPEPQMSSMTGGSDQRAPWDNSPIPRE